MLGENARLLVVSETQSNLIFNLQVDYNPHYEVKTSFTFHFQIGYTFLPLYSNSSLAISWILE